MRGELARSNHPRRLINVRRDEFILAAREKLYEVAEKLARLGKSAKAIELKQAQISPQKDPVIDLIEHARGGFEFGKNRGAECVKRAELNFLPALADCLRNAPLHFARGFFCKGEAEDLFARQIRLSFQQVANAFGNHASFAGARACDHEKRPASCSTAARCCAFRKSGRAAPSVTSINFGIRRHRSLFVRGKSACGDGGTDPPSLKLWRA